MPDWNADSPLLAKNLTDLLQSFQSSADLRPRPDLDTARVWHRRMLEGLAVPDPAFLGTFRGEPSLEDAEVHVLGHFGTPAAQVAVQLDGFAATLQRSVAALDSRIAPGKLPNPDQLSALLDLCAWTHAEWVRIHPLANGNGRIARLWVNWLAMRYGLPPFLRLRPRPDISYEDAASRAMEGDWRPTALVLRQLFTEFVRAL